MEERAGRYSHIIFKAYAEYEDIDFKSWVEPSNINTKKSQ